MKKILTLILIVILTSSCNTFIDDEYKEGEQIFLEHKSAIMPVWIKGNVNSKTFCVFLHGGPGLTSLTYANNEAYQNLEQEFAIVYWDQRASGASQGNAQPETITLDQFVDDTDRVIDLIRSKYKVDQVFLIGKSWGGALGTAYLLSEAHQEKIKGWIEIDGAHNWKKALQLSVSYMKTYANAKIDSSENIKYWKEVKEFYQSYGNDRDFHFWRNHGTYLNVANAIYKDPANDPGNSLSWNAPIPILSILNAIYVSEHMLDEMSNLDLTSEMHLIKVPSLILWGRHDYNISVELGYEAYDLLGTEILDKHLFIFEESAHSPSFEQPNLFTEQISLFVDTYK